MNQVGAVASTGSVSQDESTLISFPKLMRVACCVFGFSLLLAVLSSRGLYADGANVFYQVLQEEAYVASLPCRLFSSFLIQLPLVIAIKLGVRDLQVLRFAFGLGCFLPWPLVMALCHRLAPRHFWIVAVACAAGYLNAAFMAVGEHIVAHAFFWPALFALLFVRPLTPFAAAVLVGSATILLSSYESLLFLGPPLAALSLWRAFRPEEGKWQRAALWVSTLLSLAAAALALKNIIHPSIPVQMSNFRFGVRLELYYPAWTVGWSMLWSLLIVTQAVPSEWSRRIPHRVLLAVLFYVLAIVIWHSSWIQIPRASVALLAAFAAVMLIKPEFKRFLKHRMGIVILSGAIVCWGAWPLLMPQNLDPARQFSARFLNLVVPLLLFPVALILAWRPERLGLPQPALATFGATFLLAQSLWHVCATWQWHGYVGVIRGVLASHTGPVNLADTPYGGRSLRGQALTFDWWWANPCLSIALSSDGKINSLIMPGRRAAWQPFDPLDPAQLPRLAQYGIDYSQYVAALGKDGGRSEQ